MINIRCGSARKYYWVVQYTVFRDLCVLGSQLITINTLRYKKNRQNYIDLSWQYSNARRFTAISVREKKTVLPLMREAKQTAATGTVSMSFVWRGRGLYQRLSRIESDPLPLSYQCQVLTLYACIRRSIPPNNVQAHPLLTSVVYDFTGIHWLTQPPGLAPKDGRFVWTLY